MNRPTAAAVTSHRKYRIIVSSDILFLYYETDGGESDGREGKTIFPDNISILTIVNIVYHRIIVLCILVGDVYTARDMRPTRMTL